MNIQHSIRTPDFQPNIPLLDREFDTKSPELDDFIYSFTGKQDENPYIMEFHKKTNR